MARSTICVARSCRRPSLSSTLYTRIFESSVKRVPLAPLRAIYPKDLVVQFVAIEPADVEGPALLHDRKGLGPGFLLLRSQNAFESRRHDARHGLTAAGDRDLVTRLDLADAARKSLVCLPKAPGLAPDSRS